MLVYSLSDGLNHRTDAYGGSLENRARFPLECIRAIRAAMPEGMPLFMRIDAQDDGFGEAGLTVEDTITFCNWAKDAGVDVLDVSRGNIVTAASKYEVPPLDLPRGFNVDNAARTLKLKGHDSILCEAGDALGGQFVLAGKAPRKEEMEAAIQSMASQVQRMGGAGHRQPQTGWCCSGGRLPQAEHRLSDTGRCRWCPPCHERYPGGL